MSSRECFPASPQHNPAARAADYRDHYQLQTFLQGLTVMRDTVISCEPTVKLNSRVECEVSQAYEQKLYEGISNQQKQCGDPWS